MSPILKLLRSTFQHIVNLWMNHLKNSHCMIVKNCKVIADLADHCPFCLPGPFPPANVNWIMVIMSFVMWCWPELSNRTRRQQRALQRRGRKEAPDKKKETLTLKEKDVLVLGHIMISFCLSCNDYHWLHWRTKGALHITRFCRNVSNVIAASLPISCKVEMTK